MFDALTMSLIAFVLIAAGGFIGVLLRNLLPEHHLSADSKDVIRLGSGLIATIAALVLSLLITSAKSSFDAQSNQIKDITANIVLVDYLLAEYGPESHAVRDLARRAVVVLVNRIWRENGSGTLWTAPFGPTDEAERTFAKLQELSPQNDTQRYIKGRVIETFTQIARSRLILFEYSGSSLPLPFLAVLIFWLAVIFASFSLFSRLSATAVVALSIFALSASGAIFLILEMNQPFTGLMQISKLPLLNALAPLER